MPGCSCSPTTGTAPSATAGIGWAEDSWNTRATERLTLRPRSRELYASSSVLRSDERRGWHVDRRPARASRCGGCHRSCSNASATLIPKLREPCDWRNGAALVRRPLAGERRPWMVEHPRRRARIRRIHGASQSRTVATSRESRHAERAARLARRASARAALGVARGRSSTAGATACAWLASDLTRWVPSQWIPRCASIPTLTITRARRACTTTQRAA